MPRRSRLLVATLLSLMLVIAAGACNDDDTEPNEDHTAQSQDDLTPPGSTLEVGQTATVPLGSDKDDQILRITITEIAKGHAADLAPLDRPAPGAETPYYVHYELELVSGGTPYLLTHHILSAWAGHTQLDQLTILEPFPQCEEKTFLRGSSVGTTVVGCTTYVTRTGDPRLNRIQFSNHDNYTASNDSIIAWES